MTILVCGGTKQLDGRRDEQQTEEQQDEQLGYGMCSGMSGGKSSEMSSGMRQPDELRGENGWLVGQLVKRWN